MLTAKDIMTAPPITLAPDTDIVAAGRLLLEKKINGMPVVDEDGTLVGVICQSDLVAQQKKLTMPSVFTLLDGMIPLSSQADMEKEIRKMSAVDVSQAMTTPPVSVGLTTPLDEVASMMVDRKLYTLPVVDGGKVVGVIGKEDILKTLVRD